MKRNETAFPQPIAPSGYELNTENAGLTKLEYAKIELAKALLATDPKNFDPKTLAEAADRYAKAILK